jgi:mannosyltransferase
MLLVALVVAGAAIRFSTLREQSFWLDEATTRQIVAGGLAHVFRGIARTESTPPLYYVVLWLWSRVFGLGEAGLRSLSALAGTLTIPVVFAVARRLESTRAALLAAALAAFNPLLFWYSQEARAYALVVLLSAVSLYLLLRALAAPTRGAILAWGFVCALALATHYYAATVVVPEAVWLLATLHRRGELTAGRLALGPGMPLLAGVALLPLLVAQADGRASFIAASGSLPYRLGQLVKQDIIGDGQPHKQLLLSIGVILVAVAVGPPVLRVRCRQWSRALLPALVGLAGIALALLVSVTISDYFITRNLLPTWPPLAIAVALCAALPAGSGRGPLAVTGLVLLSLFCVFNVITNPQYQRDDWRGAARALGPAASARAVVSSADSQIALEAYLQRLAPYPAAGLEIREVDVIWLDRGGYGRPLVPVRPEAFPGFELREARTSSYVVLRYLAAAPRLESAAALTSLYPRSRSDLVLLQEPAPPRAISAR